MRTAAALVAALAMLTLTSQATAFDTKKVSMDHRPLNCSRMKAPAMLRCAKAQLRHARFELRHINSRHSRGYWQWRVKVTRRWIRQAKWRIAHPPIAHLSLWLCIHRYEGAWNDPDSGGSGHYGGLQMTSPWGRGVYYVYRADWLSPYMQMRKAELGYAASGYSYSWLVGQWSHYDCASAYG